MNMATTGRDVLLIVYFSGLLQLAEGYYCDNDKCLEDEFCCGENICCVSYKVWELWYFWCGLLFCLFLLSLCACFWRQRERVYWVFNSTTLYRPLDTDPNMKYNPSHSDHYHTKDRSFSPPFYGPTPQQQSWHMPHPSQTVPPPEYSHTDVMYDNTDTRKPDY